MNKSIHYWPSKKIKDITTYVNRGISPKYVDTEGIIVLNQKCIRDNRILLEKSRLTDPNQKEIPANKYIQAFDVLVNSTGVGTLGRVAQIKNVNEKMTVDSHVTIIRPNSSIDKKYFGYSMIFKQPDIELMGEGATGQTELSRDRIKENIEIPIPPTILHQKKIAQILSNYDDLIDNNDRRIKILESIAKLIYDEWFVKFKFPGHKNTKFVDSEFGKIPKEWEIKKLNYFIDFKRGIEPGSINYFEKESLGTIRFIRVGDLGERESKIFIDNNIALEGMVNQKDILISMDGSAGIVKIGLSGCISSGIRKIVFKKELPWSFVYLLLKSQSIQDIIKAHAKGTTILHAASSIEYMNFVMPPKELLQRFGVFVDNIINSCLLLEKKNQCLVATRDLLLPKLISGELDVSELDIPFPEAKL